MATPTGRRWRRSNDDVARPHRLEVKLSDSEDARITAEAQIRNISKPAVLMRAHNADSATAAAHFDMLAQDLLLARRVLASVATNINQAVMLEHTRRLDNTGGGPDLERELREQLPRLHQLMEQITAIVERAEQ